MPTTIEQIFHRTVTVSGWRHICNDAALREIVVARIPPLRLVKHRRGPVLKFIGSLSASPTLFGEPCSNEFIKLHDPPFPFLFATFTPLLSSRFPPLRIPFPLKEPP